MVASQYESSGPSLQWVLGTVATVTLLFGVFAYKRYAESERWVAHGISTMDEVGRELTAEGCIDRVLEWQDACWDEGANGAVCLQGINLTMFHCLAARDRSDVCRQYESPQLDPRGKVDYGDWVYMRCAERGNKCKIRRECGCAEAYRALQSFCKSGQKGVQVKL